MQVTFVDESKKRARRRVACVLDRYLYRIAHGTWRGRLSAEGLRVVAAQLRHRASRHTAVACYVDGRSGERPAFHIGSRARFNAAGRYAIAQRASWYRRSSATTPGWRQLQALVDIAALLHDIGKAAAVFQAKLRGRAPAADPVRHELISMLFIGQLLERSADDAQLLQRLAAPDPDTLQEAYAQAAEQAQAVLATEQLPPIQWDAQRPLASALLLLVGTHHKLIDAELAESRIDLKPTHHIHPQRDTAANGGAGTEHAPYPSLFHEPRFQEALQRAAGRLVAQEGASLESVPAAVVYAYGRLALQLGDHYASALGSQRRDAAAETEQLFANTGKDDETGESWLAEPLVDHLIAVARQSRGFMRALRRGQDAFPQVHEHELPDALAHPTRQGPFAWQGDAVSKVQASAAPEYGFFGLVMARTGSGKTRGAPAILRAAAGRCRFFLGLGLRTLALQSGDEYAEQIGLQPWHLQTLIGDETARALHQLAREEPEANTADRGGSSAEEQDVFDAPLPAYGEGGAQGARWRQDPDYEPSRSELGALGGGPGHEPNLGALPERIARALEDTREQRAQALLRTPVIAATLDQLMSAADAHAGRHLYRMLRLATSDLLLDEVDSYEPEDLAAITRLIFLAGVFGRQVVIASATLPPSIARALFTAYYEGRQAHAQLTGTSASCLAGWISDEPELTQIEPHNPASFAQQHDERIGRVVEALDRQPPRRRVELVHPEARSEEAAYGAITHTARHMHERHAVSTEQGMRVSVGVVRLANIRSCRAYTRHLLEAPLEALAGITLAVTCYHSRLFGAVRYELERRLNRMLRRQGPDPEAGLLAEPAVQHQIDRARRQGHTDVLILVVASPVEEIGRDHDFDYAIMEPSSIRSLIQMAGRVLRHRDQFPAAPNCAVLDAPLRYYRGEPAPYYSYPGVETPLKAPKLEAQRLTSPWLTELLDTERLAERLDARLSLIEPEGEAPELAAKEHGLLARTLEQGAYPALRFAREPTLPFTSWMPANRRFRRGDPQQTFWLELDAAGEEAGRWRMVDERGESRPVDAQVQASDLSSTGAGERLLFRLEPHELLTDLERRLGFTDRQRACRELLAVSMELGAEDQLAYDPALGIDRLRR